MNSSAVTAVHHDDGIVFLHKVNGMLFASNRVGAAIWIALQDTRTTREIASEMSSVYAIPHSTACEHVDAFVATLATHGLIEGPPSC